MADQSIAQKTCTKCGERKPTEAFYKHQQCKGGRSAHCRACHSIAVKNWKTRQPIRERQSWMMAKSRCYNANNEQYQDYGGRGIQMCEAWRTSFEAFYRDMGPRPPETSLDRIDGNGHYEPGNCRWATRAVQNANTRSARLLTVGGVTRSVTEWAKHTGINRDTLNGRLIYGWSADRAVSEPVHKYRKRAVRAHITSPPTPTT